MKVTVVVQARLGSRRLPNKILMPIDGRPLLAHVLERVKLIRGIDPWVILAVPRIDRERIRLALWKDRSAFGSGGLSRVVMFSPTISEDDVLLRYVMAARFARADALARITADCPLLSPDASSLVVDRYLDGDVDYASNVGPANGWPDGWDTEVISVKALEHMNEIITDPFHREHVTTWLRMSTHSFRVADVRSPGDRSGEKWSVDSLEDLERVRAIVERKVA